MNFPDPKKLKKLASACRKAGLKSFKCADFEFVLADDAPVSSYKRSKVPAPQPDAPASSSLFQSDTLSDEELLFWSSGTAQENTENS